MARRMGEDVGATVGYRIRFERRVSAATRIEVVTEGILTRMLQDDPMLEGIGALLFDEFHERHLAADLGLALALDVQAQVRPDLRIVAMSATLDGERLAAFLDAPRISSAGRAFPVERFHFPARCGRNRSASNRNAGRRSRRSTSRGSRWSWPRGARITCASRILRHPVRWLPRASCWRRSAHWRPVR
jgi:ATP-dependent helicase HrpB